MIRFKIALRSMLSLPVIREAETHYTVAFYALIYFIILFMVLKTFQYNKDRYEK